MKKAFSILLVVVVMLSNFVLPVYAENQDNVQQFKYFDKFYNSYFSQPYFDYEYILQSYNEIYYHYDELGEEPDWSLIYCLVYHDPVDIRYGTVVGNRVLSVTGVGLGFREGYGVYINETDSFIEMRQENLEKIIELCPDFIASIEENEIGQAFGDVDNDSELTVIDATYIQRQLAEYYDMSFYKNSVRIDGGKSKVSISDFDRDGEVSILDATAIQLKLAGLEY